MCEDMSSCVVAGGPWHLGPAPSAAGYREDLSPAPFQPLSPAVSPFSNSFGTVYKAPGTSPTPASTMNTSEDPCAMVGAAGSFSPDRKSFTNLDSFNNQKCSTNGMDSYKCLDNYNKDYKQTSQLDNAYKCPTPVDSYKCPTIDYKCMDLDPYRPIDTYNYGSPKAYSDPYRQNVMDPYRQMDPYRTDYKNGYDYKSYDYNIKSVDSYKMGVIEGYRSPPLDPYKSLDPYYKNLDYKPIGYNMNDPYCNQGYTNSPYGATTQEQGPQQQTAISNCPPPLINTSTPPLMSPGGTPITTYAHDGVVTTSSVTTSPENQGLVNSCMYNPWKTNGMHSPTEDATLADGLCHAVPLQDSAQPYSVKCK